MPQLLSQDNIPTPVVASTTSLTLATTNLGQPTSITVGGQSYQPSATLTLNAATTGANGLDTGSLGAIQLWYLYAIVNSSTFALALVASQTAPSTGPLIPSGYYSAYKLVGAFYTDGASLVGSSVPITGTIATSFMSYTPIFNSFGTVTALSLAWSRQADKLKVNGYFIPGTPTAATASISVPGSLAINSTPFGGGLVVIKVGTWNRNTSTAGQIKNGLLVINTANGNAIFFTYNDTAAAASPNTLQQASNIIGAGQQTNIEFEVPIVGWNATLL